MAEQAFRPAGLPISGRLTPAAFPFYTTGEDNLRIVSYNAAAGVVVKLTARLLGSDGRPTPDNWTHAPTTDRAAKSDDFPLSGLTLLNLQVSVVAGTPVMGQTYVVVQLIRGLGAAAIVLGTIASGYVTPARAIGWPGSPLESPLENGGYYRQVQGTVPALGTDWAETVPTGARWQLVMLSLQLFTDATPVNRWPIVRLPTSATTYLMIVPPAPVPASNVLFYDLAAELLAQNQTTAAGVLRFNVALPPEARLLAGQNFNVVTLNLAAGDSWSLPVYLVREWLEG